MKQKKVKKVKCGLYRIFWKDGGSSLAAIGNNANGGKWFAPVNWVSVPSYDWKVVSSVDAILITKSEILLEQVYSQTVME